MPWVTVADSDIGNREEQQDRYLIVRSDDAHSHLLVVADGAGGHKMGALAAQTAINCIQNNLANLWRSEDPMSVLTDLIIQCNERVLAIGDEEIACSTLVMVFVRGDELFWAHVGDSRLYLIRDDQVSFQTTDHSVAELKRQHDKDGIESSLSDSSSELYMCLGALNEVVPEVQSGLARDGDTLLLCSDGLWGQLDMDFILSELTSAPLDVAVMKKLTALAKSSKQDTSDNITLIAASYSKKPSFFANPIVAFLSLFNK